MVKHIIWGTGFCLSTTYAGSRGMGYYMAGMVKVFAGKVVQTTVVCCPKIKTDIRGFIGLHRSYSIEKP